MPTVVGLTFEENGCVHYYVPGPLFLTAGELVVVDTPNGLQMGRVVVGPQDIPPDRLPFYVDSVVRSATPYDVAQHASNARLVAEAHPVVRTQIEQLGLPMKVVDIVSTWDGGKLTVFFSAEGRIDFRELVRDLTAALGVRIHMYQVGARDHAKLLGGLGSCGLEICCTAWMKGFEPVSMRMAKEQSLFLNPSKFSGNCGKLKCCLRYEYEFYSDSHEDVLAIGATVETPQGTGRVVDINLLKQSYTVQVADVGRVEMRMLLGVGSPEGHQSADGAADETTDPDHRT